VGFVADVLEFLRSIVDGAQTPEVKVDRGGGDTATGYHFACPGDDSRPLAGDDAYLADDEGAGNRQAVGYRDQRSTPKAGAGEKRIYSRSAPGVMAAEVWLKADGTIVVTNAIGVALQLAPSGAASVSNALGSIDLDAAGNVTATTPLGTFGAGTHGHNSPFGPIGPPIPGT
jgi:hypothetical protein